MRQNVQQVRAAVGPLKKTPMGAYSSKAKVYALGGALVQTANVDDEAALHLAKKYLQDVPAETPIAEVLADAREMFGAAEDMPDVALEEIAGGSMIGDFLRNAASKAASLARTAYQHAKPAASAAANYALETAKKVAEEAVRQRIAAQMAAAEAKASAEQAAEAAAEAETANEPANLAELIRRDTAVAKKPAAAKKLQAPAAKKALAAKKKAAAKKARGAGPISDVLDAIGLGAEEAEASGAGPLSFMANLIGLGEEQMDGGAVRARRTKKAPAGGFGFADTLRILNNMQMHTPQGAGAIGLGEDQMGGARKAKARSRLLGLPPA